MSLTQAGCALRRERLWDRVLSPLGCDLALVSAPADLARLAGFAPEPFVFQAGGAGAFLLLERGSCRLITDNMSEPFARAAHVDEARSAVWYEGRKSVGDRASVRIAAAIQLLGESAAKPRAIAVDAAYLPSSLAEALRDRFPSAAIRDITQGLVAQRRAKDPDELAVLRESIAAAEAGHAAALRGIRPGMTELDAFHLVERSVREKLGAQALVYGDFVSGPRTELVGGPPSLRTIERGDRFILDFSVVLHGYRCDFANTFVVAAKPTTLERECFDLCRQALAASEALLQPDVPTREVDQAVRSVFRHAGKDGLFRSHSGHGIGVGHPEAPFIVPESDETLDQGDVVTLEPGLYEPGVIGMRYERNYAIAANTETLSRHEIRLEQP